MDGVAWIIKSYYLKLILNIFFRFFPSTISQWEINSNEGVVMKKGSWMKLLYWKNMSYNFHVVTTVIIRSNINNFLKLTLLYVRNFLSLWITGINPQIIIRWTKQYTNIYDGAHLFISNACHKNNSLIFIN